MARGPVGARASRDGACRPRADAPKTCVPEDVEPAFGDDINCIRDDVICCVGEDQAVRLSVTCDIVWMQEQPLAPRHR